ncbi:MAG: tyrosine-type recombinase/integrase [Roseburia sp.]|nr:tyrosine-type recombinase/integrase [Roseburia sp.]
MNKNSKSNTTISTTNISALTEQLKCANMSNEVSDVLKELENMLNRQFLENHPYKIYYSEAEQNWITYVVDETRKDNRRRVKRKSKENLENYLIEFYKEKQQQDSILNITLEKLYERFLIHKRDKTAVTGKTLVEYTNEWNKFFKGTDLAKMRVKDITPKALTNFYRSLTKDRAYTYKSISNGRALLNGIMYLAVEEEIILHNPVLDVNFKDLPYKPVKSQKNNVYTKKETAQLLTYLKDINEPYALAIQLSFYLFIRIGETKAIRFEDIDLENRSVFLHSQVLNDRQLNDDLTFTSREVIVSDHIKGNTEKGYRTQKLTDEAIEIIEKARLLNPNGTYLFEPNGKVMNTDTFNKHLKKYCEACGVRYFSSHKIRFYNASTAYDGKNLTTISTLMGHSKVATTLHYLRNVELDDESSEAFKKLGLSSKKETKE